MTGPKVPSFGMYANMINAAKQLQLTAINNLIHQQGAQAEYSHSLLAFGSVYLWGAVVEHDSRLPRRVGED